MNAAPPVFQAQPISDAVQPDAPAPAAAAATRAGSQDFAAALSDAGVKPARKNAASKQQDPPASGSSLPAPGSQPPLAPAAPPPAKTDVSAATVADAAAIVKAPPGSAQGPPSSAIAAASTAPANASGITTIPKAPSLDPAAPAAPAAGDAATTESAASALSVPGSVPTMPHLVSMRTLATPGTSTAATAPKIPAGNPRSAQSSDATAKQGTITSANSALSSTEANAQNDSTSSNGAAAGTDAGAQAVMAAAVAQGTGAPAPDSSWSDDLAAPDTEVAQGAATLGGPAAMASAAAASMSAAMTASISAAVNAATAAAVAPAISDAASASAADKRSHGESPDAALSGASNDGSAGAAQLLTSNTSTDSAPMPTFKVAAGVDTAQFGQGVADRVSLMMDGNLTSARLQVNPPALGPIEVRIALQGGHAQVWLSSHSAVTRDALEASSPKLREMLGSQGFSQVSVDISHRSFQERSPQSQVYESAPSGDAPVSAQAPLSMSRSVSGLLDAYA